MIFSPSDKFVKVFALMCKELAIDGAKFADMKHGGLWIVEEHVIMDDIDK